MNDNDVLRTLVSELRRLKTLGDKALAQVPTDEALNHFLDAEANSIVVIVRHMAGNMRSRWTDFLTTDGEKPDRDRDSELELGPADTRAALTAKWEAGWRLLFAAVESLGPDDLRRTVTVRGEPHTVLQALDRQLVHYAQHVGQIVLLAKLWAGPAWRTLSIPKGESKRFEVAKDGTPYRIEGERR
jgi:hypothetical protein